MISLLPPGVNPAAHRVLAARSLRSCMDGFVSLLLPHYLTLLGYNAWQIGILITATLLGSGVTTLGVGFTAHRAGTRRLLMAAAVLMATTGFAIAAFPQFWPLLLIAFIGTINPSNGDVSVFLPLEQATLAHAAPSAVRTALFARYTLGAGLAGALGAQGASLPAMFVAHLGITEVHAVQLMFMLYGATGAIILLLYRGLPSSLDAHSGNVRAALGPSRRRVLQMAAVFSLDSFGGGFAVQSLLALWLYQRYGLSVAAAASLFFWLGLLTAASQLAASWLAARIGLINTMVCTHLPANLAFALVPFMPSLPLAIACLSVRALLSSMDVPARTSFVMAVVTPPERPAAASITNVPRSFAAALSPALAGYMLSISSFGWPLVACGVCKIAYDLTLLKMFRRLKPPEESS